MATWTARVTSVSAVDASGAFDVGYDIHIDGVLTYPNLTARGSTRVEVLAQVKAYAAELQRVVSEASKVYVGLEVEI